MEIRTVVENRIEGKKKIARHLGIKTDSENIFLRHSPGTILAFIGVIEVIAQTHDEVILIAIPEQWIVGRDLIYKIICALR